MLVGRRGDVGDHLAHAFRHFDNFTQGIAGLSGGGDAFVDLPVAGEHRLDRALGLMLDVLDHLGDFLGGRGGAFGQLAHFVGDDGKAASLLAGAGGFDGGVQRQQVGLVGDVVNHADDFADLI